MIMTSINAGNLKKGDFIKHNGEIWQVTKAEFYSPGKGSALMRSVLKNLKSGKTLQFTYKSGEPVEQVEVDAIEYQFLYKDNENLYFMDNRTYEQITIPSLIVGDAVNYFKEGEKMFVLVHNDQALSVRPPQSVKLLVTQAEDAVKGNTVTGAKKQVTVETGATILVPLFVKKGDTIVINPETGEYMERFGKQY